MKLTLHNDINVVYITGSLSFNPDDFIGIEKAKLETTVSTGYTDKLLAEEWDDLKWLLADMSIGRYKIFRNDLISTFSVAAVWDTLTDISKKALVRNYVWKSTETTANLDLLYTQTERDDFQKQIMELLNSTCDCDIRKSVTVGSTKYFDQQNDDTGVITTVEVITDQVL